MRYFAHVKLPFEHDYSEFAKYEPKQNLDYLIKPHDVLGPDLPEFLKSVGLVLTHTALFYTDAKTLLPIHTDMSDFPNFAKLNFAYGAEGSRMFWYELKDGYTPVPKVTADTQRYRVAEGKKVSYVSIPPDKCTIAASAKIGAPTLINAGQPHSMLNNTNEKRWCISIPLAGLDGHIVEMDEALERLEGFIK
jgi:hypothetical protein